MTIAIDHVTDIITIEKADMTLVQTVPYDIYELDFDVLHNTLRTLEANEESTIYPRTHDHNTIVTISGTVLARVVLFLDPYTVTVEDGAYAVKFVGANTNMIDKANLNNVSFREGNTAGLQQVSSGSGLSAAQDTKLTNIDIRSARHEKIINNYKELIKIASSWYLVIYDDGEISGGTEILRKKMEDSFGNDISDLVAGVLAAELENTV